VHDSSASGRLNMRGMQRPSPHISDTCSSLAHQLNSATSSHYNGTIRISLALSVSYTSESNHNDSSSSHASLIALPIELKLEILRAVPDLPSLRCLKLASRDFCDLARYCHDRGVFKTLYEHEAEQRKIDPSIRHAHSVKGKIIQRWRPEIERVICDGETLILISTIGVWIKTER